MNFRAAASAVLGREAVRALDQRTIAAGTPARVLMESAGQALADFVQDSGATGIALPAGGGPGRLLVLAGSGNNGGDGFVAARCGMNVFGRNFFVGLIQFGHCLGCAHQFKGAQKDIFVQRRIYFAFVFTQHWFRHKEFLCFRFKFIDGVFRKFRQHQFSTHFSSFEQ